MPRKAETQHSSSESSKSATRSMDLPKFSVDLNKLKGIKTNQVLVILLVVAAFLIGVLWTKVEYLQGGQAGNTAAVPSQQGTAAQATPAPGAKVNVGVGRFPALGNKNAKVTVIEFADFRCPFCEQFFTNTWPQIKKDYVDTGKIQFYFRQYAFLGPASVVAADAAECANDQGKFWAFHDYLYQNQPAETDTSMYNTDTLTQAATSLGIDGTTFSTCLNNKTDDAKATQDMTDGQKAGVSGTPTFFINGVALVGAQPYSAFQTAIDQALASAK